VKIHSFNEWDPLREIIVGEASRANWPTKDPVWIKSAETTLYKDSPLPHGPVPQWIIDEANEDLQGLCDILTLAGVTVNRPSWLDFQSLDGMYNYCPRDRLLVAGNTIVDPAMMIPCRDMEWKSLAKVIAGNSVKYMPRNEGMALDAANILRLNNNWLYLESESGNREAYNWLVEQFPDINIEMCNFYAGVHIDSTILALREGLAVVNASRVMPEYLPKAIQDWDIIYAYNVVAQDFYQYPIASKWIGLNMLSIDPNTVIVDKNQTELIRDIERKGLTVVPHELRHSRTLGGGFHCVTLDTWREA